MPVRLDIAAAPAIMCFVFEGDWTSTFELIELRRAAVRAGHLTDKGGVLFDLRRATTVPNIADVRLAILAAQDDAVWPVRRAFLVANQDQYAIARQLQMFGPQSVVSEIFQNERKAMEWLSRTSEPRITN